MPIKKCPLNRFEDCIEDECRWFAYTWPDEQPGGLPERNCAVVFIAKHLESIGEEIEGKAT